MDGGSLGSRGSSGEYWTPNATSTARAVYMSINNTEVIPGTNNLYRGSKYGGRAVRCIANLNV